MPDRECIFAYTPPGADYPPYLNITREADGRVMVIVRGEKRTPEDTDYPFDMPGHTVRIELPDAQRALLLLALTETDFDWGALQALRKASA